MQHRQKRQEARCIGRGGVRRTATNRRVNRSTVERYGWAEILERADIPVRSRKTRRAASSLLATLVVQIEIQQVPVHEEPKKTEATDRQQGVPNLVPNPLRRVGPGLDGANDGQEGADPAEETYHLK
jgi:hypothetical protein